MHTVQVLFVFFCFLCHKQSTSLVIILIKAIEITLLCQCYLVGEKPLKLFFTSAAYHGLLNSPPPILKDHSSKFELATHNFTTHCYSVVFNYLIGVKALYYRAT